MNRYSRLVHQIYFFVRRFISHPKSQLPLIITTNTDDHIQFVSKCRTDLEVKPAYKNGYVLSLNRTRAAAKNHSLMADEHLRLQKQSFHTEFIVY